eukprot:CAMPEP_0172747676 /NCGR_PEP_ID=MMETSP1074-20121228/143305_1 /TAXON_ID=2916 /ORGANISM="Ceratium fusus, Strain PA161109" /LENGTH=52 /DNA_ID=CAMNT_0013579249 /DNA_START=101 /DNA_END=259 /DNA_ORIENTATION=+
MTVADARNNMRWLQRSIDTITPRAATGLKTPMMRVLRKAMPSFPTCVMITLE